MPLSAALIMSEKQPLTLRWITSGLTRKSESLKNVIFHSYQLWINCILYCYFYWLLPSIWSATKFHLHYQIVLKHSRGSNSIHLCNTSLFWFHFLGCRKCIGAINYFENWHVAQIRHRLKKRHDVRSKKKFLSYNLNHSTLSAQTTEQP
jgi:hypothetical protein